MDEKQDYLKPLKSETLDRPRARSARIIPPRKSQLWMAEGRNGRVRVSVSMHDRVRCMFSQGKIHNERVTKAAG